MKFMIAILSLAGFVVCAHAAVAADAASAPAKAHTPQQQKMKQCNADAKGKKGDERKAFMKECLSAKPADAPVGADKK
jgi:psiF repeat-containing protein